jgi:hypothetical protein
MNCFSIVSAMLIAATIAGCTGYDPSSIPPGIQSLRDQRHAALEGLRDTALRPLRLWQNEQLPSCESPNLQKARETVLTAANMLTPDRSGVDAVMDSGSWILEVADDAQERGCKPAARSLYDAVIAIYTGGAYTALRQRAQIGIGDLRH